MSDVHDDDGRRNEQTREKEKSQTRRRRRRSVEIPLRRDQVFTARRTKSGEKKNHVEVRFSDSLFVVPAEKFSFPLFSPSPARYTRLHFFLRRVTLCFSFSLHNLQFFSSSLSPFLSFYLPLKIG